MHLTQAATVHDVVVIGSGAGGGTATKVLADLGVSVLLMEAGPMLNMSDLKEHMWPYNVPHRGAGPKVKRSGPADGVHLRRDVRRRAAPGEPYTVAPGSDFSWSDPDPRRPNQSLRPHVVPLFRLRLQTLLARRPGLGLADLL
jgi:choline dehydrogenase-like flavoprotein